jgi:hypothetical protein
MTVAFNADTDLQVQISFASNPYVVSPSWVDVSADVRRVSTFRGRSDELDTIGPGAITLELDNTSGAYDSTNAGGAHFPNVKPMRQIRVRAVHNSITYDVWKGWLNSFPQQWPDWTGALVVAEGFDGFGILGRVFTIDAESQETSGVRVGHLLDSAAWPATWRNLATGDVTVQAFTPACSPVLNLLRQVEDTEAGLLYIAGNGNVGFQDRSHRSGAVPQATFGDTGSEIRYRDLVIDQSEQQIWNRVEVQRVGGATIAAEDATSIGEYLERQLQVFDTLHISDGEATTLATTLRDRFKDPYPRIEQIDFLPQRITPAGNEDLAWVEALGREISDQITVKRRPKQAGNLIDEDVFIEGIRHDVNAVDREWATTFSLSGRPA